MPCAETCGTTCLTPGSRQIPMGPAQIPMKQGSTIENPCPRQAKVTILPPGLPTMTGIWVKLRPLLPCDHQRRVRTRRLRNLFFHSTGGKAKRPEGLQATSPRCRSWVGPSTPPSLPPATWAALLLVSLPHAGSQGPLHHSILPPAYTSSGSPSSFSLDPLCVVPGPLLTAAQCMPG